MWRSANKDIAANNAKKATLVLASQWMLLIAILFVTSLTVSIVMEWI